MKKVIKYQVFDFKSTIIIYYLIFAAVFCLSFITDIIKLNGTTSTNGTELSSLIVCFICGIVMFKEYYWLFTQNGISRKTYIKEKLLILNQYGTDTQRII